MDNALYLEGQFQFQFIAACRRALRRRLDRSGDSTREDEDSLRQIRIGADLLYNWEHGAWHPYVGGGLGAHLLQEKDNGRDLGDGESKLGGSVLGGVEYFFTRDTVISGEARYQFVQDIRGVSPSGAAAGRRAEEVLLGAARHDGVRYAFTFFFSSLSAMACGCFA